MPHANCSIRSSILSEQCFWYALLAYCGVFWPWGKVPLPYPYCQAKLLRRCDRATMNVLRKLRVRLGLTRTDFASKVGRSLESLRNYERGHAPPREVLERAAQLWPNDFKAVVGEAGNDAPNGEEQEWIAMLLDILRSGNEKVVVALRHNMEVFHDVAMGHEQEVLPGVTSRHRVVVGDDINADRKRSTARTKTS